MAKEDSREMIKKFPGSVGIYDLDFLDLKIVEPRMEEFLLEL